MWLSEQTKAKMPMEDAELGVTTVTGDQLAVVTRGEQRDLVIFGPGGYVWRPESGEQVVVLQGGPGGTERWVAGCRQGKAPDGMEPGEVYLHSGNGASIRLKNDGTIVLKGSRIAVEGQLTINGVPCCPGCCGG